MILRAISVRQPYAWAIVAGIKDIENRHARFANYTGFVLIHASKKSDSGPYPDALMRQRRPTVYQFGGFIGAAVISGHVTESDSEWFFGPKGLVLTKAAQLPFCPYKGQQGLFRVPSSRIRGWFNAHVEPLLESV